MENIIKVVVDAMGGDYAPKAPLQGAVDAVNEREDVMVYLAGQEEVIKEELAKYTYSRERIQILPASQIIETAEPPVMAIKGKKDSSIVVGMTKVRRGEADAFVSAGSTGAVLVGGQVIVGRIKGVERPPLAPLIPTVKGQALLIDCGANVDARPSHLVQFAKMGSVYMENIMKVKNPKVGILNIGAEEEKGNALVKETFPLLKACEDINFIGSLEARDVLSGQADVIVCEAFAGNCVLKTIEGTASVLMKQIKGGLMSSIRGKVGGLLIKPSLKGIVKQFDSSEHGGAPLLGLKGLVVKSHGNAMAAEIKNSIFQCVRFSKEDMNGKIKEKIQCEKLQKESE